MTSSSSSPSSATSSALVVLGQSQHGPTTGSSTPVTPATEPCYGPDYVPEHCRNLVSLELRNATNASLDLLPSPSNGDGALRPTLASALASAKSLLETFYSITDFECRYTLVKQALAIGESVCAQLANPMSFSRGESSDMFLAKEIVLISRAELVQLLSTENYARYRDVIHEHLGAIIRMHGHSLLCFEDTRFMAAFKAVKLQVELLPRGILGRVNEWKDIMLRLPTESYFASLQFWGWHVVFKMEMANVEQMTFEGDPGSLDYAKQVVMLMEEAASNMKTAMAYVISDEGRAILELFNPGEKNEGDYTEAAEHMLDRLTRVKMEVDARLALRKGDALLELATERARSIDHEYYQFQAMLALDSYRAAYLTVAESVHVNVELEGLCLWSMGRVMQRYLNLPKHAHRLYLTAVTLATTVSSALPTGVWYLDAVEQIQSYRRKLEQDDMKRREWYRAPTVEKLSVELTELRCRAESVKDESSLRSFLRWLLLRYRPKHFMNGKNGVDISNDILESRELSKVVLNVIAVYDVSDKTKYDERWVVMCEEINKVPSPIFVLPTCSDLC